MISFSSSCEATTQNPLVASHLTARLRCALLAAESRPSELVAGRREQEAQVAGECNKLESLLDAPAGRLVVGDVDPRRDPIFPRCRTNVPQRLHESPVV